MSMSRPDSTVAMGGVGALHALRFAAELVASAFGAARATPPAIGAGSGVIAVADAPAIRSVERRHRALSREGA